MEEAGITCLGRPWRALAFESQSQGRRVTDTEGPTWVVEVPVAAPAHLLAALPADLLVRTQEARDELSIFIPGRNTMTTYGTMILRLLNAHPLDDGQSACG